ncbi:MAG TPA: lactonase family protein [Opitutaceae bacterium]|nr:lactonase family protein [Opitutaceae bacterium]
MLRTAAGAVLVAALAPAGARAQAAAAPETTPDWTVYVGTFTRRSSEGIYAFAFSADTGRLRALGLAAAARTPSFLAASADGKFLYSTNELTRTTGGEGPNGFGGVSAYARIPGDYHLRFLNRQSSGGEGPCHVAVDAENRWLYAAHYNSGSVAVFALRGDGRISPASLILQDSGSGPRPRQKGPHAHCVVLDPAERFLYSCDLGADRVMVYRVGGSSGQLARAGPSAAAEPAGSGPRHIILSPQLHRAYVVNELASTVCVFDWREGEARLTLIQTVSALPAGWAGANASAELQLSPDRRFLYVSNRGLDSIARFAVGADGTLVLAENVPSGGRTPRFLTLDPSGKFLLVADEDSERIQVFRRDAASGRLSLVPGGAGAVSMPSCLVFAPPG